MANSLFIRCLLGLSLFSATAAYANNNSNNPNNADYTGWSWSGHVDHVNIDSQAANEQWIENTATAIGGAADYYSSKTENTLVLGTSFLFYRDNAAFSQYVEDYWGDTDYTESDANAIMARNTALAKTI